MINRYADVNNGVSIELDHWTKCTGLWQNAGGEEAWVYMDSMYVSGDYVYVSGQFNITLPGGGTAVNIAKYNVLTGEWSSVGDGSITDEIWAVAVDSNGRVYIGTGWSDFHDTGPHNLLQYWNGTAWTPCGSGMLGNLNIDYDLGQVSALTADGTDIYVAGTFDGGVSGSVITYSTNIIKWDGTSWHAMGTPAGNGVVLSYQQYSNIHTPMFRKIVVSGTNVFVTGYFQNSDQDGLPVGPTGLDQFSTSGSHVHAYTLNTTLDPYFNAGSGYDLAVQNGTVYLAGEFSYIDRNSVIYSVAQFNGGAWSALGSGVSGGSKAYGIAADVNPSHPENAVYVLGNFDHAGGSAIPNGTPVRWVLGTDDMNCSCAPAPCGLIGWWQGNDNQNDSAGHNPITQLDGATYAPAEVLSGFSFDGNPHQVIVPDAPELNFGAGEDFSLEVWIKPEASENTFDVASIVDKRDAPDIGHGQGYTICLVGGALACRFSDSMDDVGTAFGPAGPDLRDGKLHHVALTVSRNSATGGHLYVDGESVLTFDPTVEPGDLSNGGPLRIGNHATPGLDCFFKGLIDEVSLYARELSASEIQSIYAAGTAGKCPPACTPAPCGLIGWWQGDNNLRDSAGHNPITQLDGVTYAPAEVCSGFSFDGNAHEVIVPDAPELNFGAGQDFSIEAWVKPEVSVNTYDVASIVDKRDAPDIIHGQGYTICLVGGALACRFSDSMDDVGTAFGPAGPDLRDGNFHHVALTVSRNSASGGHLYVDGQSVLTFDPTVEPGDLSNGGPLRIGNHATPGLDCFFKGIIDEVSLYDRELSASEIQSINAAGGTGKCRPTCIRAPSSIAGWWRGDSPNDSAGHNPITQLDGVSYAPAEVCLGFSFDGNPHQVIVPDAPELNFAAGEDFSLEVWIKPEVSINTYDVASIVDKRDAPDIIHGQGYTICLVGGALACRFSDSMDDVGTAFGPSGPDLRDGNFHHVALTVSRNSVTGGQLYVDGQSVLTFDPTVEPGDLSNGGPLRIGNHATPGLDCFFKGIIDEVSLYRRALSDSEVLAIYSAGASGKCQ